MTIPMISGRLTIAAAFTVGMTLPMPAVERRITGVFHLKSETTMKVDHLIFENGSEIVTNG